MQFKIMFIDVAMKIFLHAMGIRVKVYNNFGAVGISRVESIFILKVTVRVYSRGEGTSICVVVCVQCHFPLLGFVDVIFSSQDDKVCEWNCVVDVLVLIP